MLVDGAGDLDVDADRLAGIFVVIVRFGETGRGSSSLTDVDVRTVIDGAEEIKRGVEFEVLFIVKSDDDGVVEIVDETGLFIIKRGVGLVTIGVGCGANIGGVELPDDERISEIEFGRSYEKIRKFLMF